MPRLIRLRAAARWLFADRATGRIVVAQMPNAPLWVFVAAWAALRWARPDGWTARALDVVAGLALLVWGLDEVLRGVNPWRRMLGAGVLVVAGLTRLG